MKTAKEILSDRIIKESGMNFQSLYLLAHSNTSDNDKKIMKEMEALLDIVYLAMEEYHNQFPSSEAKQEGSQITHLTERQTTEFIEGVEYLGDNVYEAYYNGMIAYRDYITKK